MDKPHHSLQIKSILKPKSTGSGTSLKGKESQTSSVKDPKKKVGISTPPHPVHANPSKVLSDYYRETPLPRVAYLPHKAVPKKPKPQAKKVMKAVPGPFKRSISTTPTPTTAGKPKASPSLPKATRIPSVKKVKSVKKIKKKSMKSMSGTVITPTTPKVPMTNTGLQYIKEIGTIKDLLMSITDPSARAKNRRHSSEGFIRPFSTEELHQLIISVEKVASIHHHIPGTSDVVDAVIQDMYKSKKAKQAKAKTGSSESTSVKSGPRSRSGSHSSSSSKAKCKSKKGKKSTKAKSSGSVKKTSSKKKKSKSKDTKTEDRAPTPGKDLTTKKSLKASVKSLFRTTRNNYTKRNKSSSSRGINSDSVLSELSELDLVTSALLNKRFYDESIALENMKSKENIPTSSPTKSKTKKSKKQKHPKPKDTDLPEIALSDSVQEIVNPKKSRVKQTESTSQNKPAKPDHGMPFQTDYKK